MSTKFTTSDQTPQREEACFDDLVLAVSELAEAGKVAEATRLIAQHPEHAERLHRLLPAIEAMAMLDASEEELAAPSTPHSLGDFRILREIGRGGMGVVYEAEQLSLGRRMALKVLPLAATLSTQQLERFKNEARLAASLKHPHIVSVHSVGVERGVHYYAMELVEGCSLAQAIAAMRNAEVTERNAEPRAPNAEVRARDAEVEVRKEGPAEGGTADSERRAPTSPLDTAGTLPLSPDPVRVEGEGHKVSDTVAVAQLSTARSDNPREYFRQAAVLMADAAAAVDYAHAAGIVHRDIKPGNLLLDADGKVHVTDFGLARLEADAGMTLTGDVLGTLRYMSPEQADGKPALVDYRTDIHALGATLYELAALRPAFAGEDRAEVLRQVIETTPAPLRQVATNVPVDFETIVAKAMEKDPADRYQSAGELAADLRAFAAGQSIAAKPPTLLTRTQRWARRHSTAVAAAFVLLLLASVGLAIAAGLISRERARTAAIAEDAKANYELALQTLEETLSELTVGELVDAQQEMTSGQRELMDRGIRFYEEIAAQNNVDPHQWSTYRYLLVARSLEAAYELDENGRIDEADLAYRKAIMLAEQNLEETPPNSPNLLDARGQVANAYNSASTFLLKREEFKLAASYLLSARELIEEHHRRLPEEVKFDFQLALNDYNMGVVCWSVEGGTQDAEDHYRRALQHLEPAVQAQPDKLFYRELLAKCRYNLGLVLGRNKRFEEAETCWRQSLADWELLATARPLKAEYASRIGATLSNLAVVARNHGDLPAARDLLETAVQHQKRALALDPADHESHSFFEKHYQLLYGVLEEEGDTDSLVDWKNDRERWEAENRSQTESTAMPIP